MTRDAAQDDATRDTLLRVADMVGGVMEFWGFKRNMGRLWCVLYLHERPMSADELRQFLSVSAGTISMTLSELQRWHCVHKTWVQGERRDYYEAETNIWMMVSRVFRERELNEIKSSIILFRDSRKGLKEAKRETPDDERLKFIDERIKTLLELAKAAETLLSAILSGDSVDASPLSMFKLPPEDD